MEKTIDYRQPNQRNLTNHVLYSSIIGNMEKSYKRIFAALGATCALALSAKLSLAAVRCESQYGGGEICVRTGELQIDKEVWNPENEKFVDNLGISDYKFAPGEKIVFKLKIKNVGDETFDKVNVKDTLPEYLELESGELEWESTDLEVDETEERRFGVRVVSTDKFPDDKTTVCVVNTAEVWSGDEKDKDTAQVCITEKVLGVEELPPTGPEGWLTLLFLSFLSGLVGLRLIKPALKRQ